MRVVIEADAELAGRRAAAEIAALIRQKPDAVLGLATGGTPVRCYRELIRMHREEGLDFARVRTFNLDEYVGLAPEAPQSYHRFMREHLFSQVNLDPAHTLVPDGQASDLDAYCEWFEQQIRAAGGIDLQLLGIGRDGHIAFNEPSSSLGSRTRVKTLTEETVRDNARFFGDRDDVPRMAVTMGVGTILEARRCLLLAIGPNKAAAIRSAVEGPVTSQVTASALQLHPRVMAVVDEPAAAWLQRRDYYRSVEAAQLQLEKRKHPVP